MWARRAAPEVDSPKHGGVRPHWQLRSEPDHADAVGQTALHVALQPTETPLQLGVVRGGERCRGGPGYTKRYYPLPSSNGVAVGASSAVKCMATVYEMSYGWVWPCNTVTKRKQLESIAHTAIPPWFQI